MLADLIYSLLGNPVERHERDPAEVMRLVRENAQREEFERLNIVKPGIIYLQDPVYIFIVVLPFFIGILALLQGLMLGLEANLGGIPFFALGIVLVGSTILLFMTVVVKVPRTIFVERQLFGKSRNFSDGNVVVIPGITTTVPYPTDRDIGDADDNNKPWLMTVDSVVTQGPGRFGRQRFKIKFQFRLNGNMPETIKENFRANFVRHRLENMTGNSWEDRLNQSESAEIREVRTQIFGLFAALADEVLSRETMEVVMFERAVVNTRLAEHLAVPFLKMGIEIILVAIDDVEDIDAVNGWIAQHERASEAERRSAADQREAIASQQARTTVADQNRLATLNELNAVEEIARKETETLKVRTRAAKMLATLNQQDLIERLRAVEGRGAEAIISKLLELTPQQYADVASKTAESLGNTPETVVLLGSNDTVNMHPVMAFAQAMERIMTTMGIGKKP